MTLLPRPKIPRSLLAAVASLSLFPAFCVSAPAQVPSVEDLVSPSCEAPAPDVDVRADKAAWRLDRRFTTREVGRIAGDRGMSLVAGRGTIGLTVAVVNGTGDFKSRAARLADGTWCVSLTSLVVRIGFDGPLSVYVGSEFERDGCAFREIVRHELRHVLRYQQAVDEMRPSVREAFVDGLAASAYSAAGASAADANDALKESVAGINEKVVTALRDYSLAENLKLDTRAEYAKVYAGCADWTR